MSVTRHCHHTLERGRTRHERRADEQTYRGKLLSDFILDSSWQRAYGLSLRNSMQFGVLMARQPGGPDLQSEGGCRSARHITGISLLDSASLVCCACCVFVVVLVQIGLVQSHIVMCVLSCLDAQQESVNLCMRVALLKRKAVCC